MRLSVASSPYSVTPIPITTIAPLHVVVSAPAITPLPTLTAPAVVLNFPAPPCLLCGKPEGEHVGAERFCPVLATYKAPW